MDFRMLGSLEVRDDEGRELPLGAGRQRALLAFLLLHENELVSTDRLVDELWGEGAPSTAAKMVQNHVSQLRRALGDRRLVTFGHGYVLEVEPGALDLDRFETLAGEGSRALATGDAGAAAAKLRDALALWRGAPLAEFAYEPFAQAAIARLEELRLTATEERIEAELALGLHAELVGELEELVRRYPLRERLHAQLMLALYRSRRQAEALEAYQTARTALVEELGLEPGEELQELQRAILARDPRLVPPPRAAVTVIRSPAPLVAQALEVVGRQSELDSALRFLDEFEAGVCALLIDGEAGIGKTTLWRAVVAAAADRQQRVLSSRSGEVETALPFTALGDLLEGVADEVLSRLPGPQREALEVALLRAEPRGQAPGGHAVALAVLAVLRALSEERPLLVAIDDVQWLDAPSAESLAFAVRRLRGEPIGFLLARRTRGSALFPLGLEAALEPGRARRVSLGPLEPAALGRLLRKRLGHQFLRPTLAELERVSGGNPFFALELARALLEREAPLAGEGLPVPATLQELLRERFGELPAKTRELLLAVSALSRPTIALVLAAAGGQRSRVALERAEAAGIVELTDERVSFTHPLLASALYAEAPPARRRALHARLAATVEDPDERARHLALAATGPDPEVAAALEAAARRARARGAPQVAAELWERASRLTPSDEPGGWQRALEAGECHLEAGDTERAHTLIENVVERLPSGHDRAVALTRLAWVRALGRGFRDGVEPFRAALAEIGDDLAGKVEIERGLAWSVHELGDVAAAEAHARAALELAEQLGEPALLASALADTAFFQTISGGGIPMELIERARALESDEEWRPILGRVRPAWIHGMLLEWAGELDAARSKLEALRESALAHGDEYSLSYMWLGSQLGRIECLAGNWPLADRYADECLQTTAQTGQEPERAYALTVKALVAAHRGQVAEARAATDEGLPLALEVGVLPAHFELLAIRGFLERSLGEEAEAHRFLGPLPAAVAKAGFGEPALFRYHGEAIENLLALGDPAAAAALLTELGEQGRRLGRVWALTIASRCQAVLAASEGDIHAAYHQLEQTLELHRDLREPFEHGRTLLLLGTLQRRDRQKRTARDTLSQALNIFEQLGAPLWAEKTRSELARTGGRTAASSALTPTEE